MIKKIKLFGWTVIEVESDDDPVAKGAPDFTSYSQPAGFVNTRIVPERPDEQGDDACRAPKV